MMLGRLVKRFEAVFAEHGIVLPDPNLGDKEYYAALAKLATGPQGLPWDFVEALFGIEMMANPNGKGRLMQAARERGLELERIQECTDADFATQIFLLAPALFLQKQEETRILRMTSFDYYSAKDPVDRRAKFERPDDAVLGRIKNDVDSWLGEEHEGEERVTEIDLFEVEGETMFLIRRGDSFARVPTVEGGQIIVRHFRPARDLVVGYSPERDELRVWGKSMGEKMMIRRVFGQRLIGDLEHFSVRQAFTLDPLRRDLADALLVEPGQGIERVVLTELESRSDDEHDAVFSIKANDVFEYAKAHPFQICPPGCRLVRAGFQVYFTGQTEPRPVVVRAGNRLQLARYCDAAAIHRWLAARGFRSPEEPGVNRIARLHDKRLERN
jgi:hypothetical protein